MPEPQAVMFTCTTYGTWLRGDMRGYVEDGVVYPANPPLHAADAARMKYPVYHFRGGYVVRDRRIHR